MLVECENILNKAWKQVKADGSIIWDIRAKQKLLGENMRVLEDAGAYGDEELDLLKQVLENVIMNEPLRRWASADTKYRGLCILYKEKDRLVKITADWDSVLDGLRAARPLYRTLSGDDPFAEIYA